MNNDTALILLLADLQRQIEALRAEVARLAGPTVEDAQPDTSSGRPPESRI